MYNIVQEHRVAINFSFAILKLLQILSSTLKVMTIKCTSILQICLRRYSAIINLIPMISRSKYLSRSTTLTQSCQCLSVLSRSKLKHLSTKCLSIFPSLMARSINRWQPLSQKSYSLILRCTHQILTQSLVEIERNQILNLLISSIEIKINVIVPTTKILNSNIIYKIITEFLILITKMNQELSKRFSLTKALLNITQKQEPLQC